MLDHSMKIKFKSSKMSSKVWLTSKKNVSSNTNRNYRESNMNYEIVQYIYLYLYLTTL